MKFCPICSSRLKNNGTALACIKCDFTEGIVSKDKSEIKTKNTTSEFNVFDEKDKDESLPTISIECEKCGNDQAVWWMLQTRSADEPTTQFYRCVKCKHTWRDYS
ncbi:MAG: transcription factor S [Candidatus Nitrosoabyssus spongiisocia]|nr:MAG: transcription factor S [Nitrosopumilaceae archaeon AB1(1)]